MFSCYHLTNKNQITNVKGVIHKSMINDNVTMIVAIIILLLKINMEQGYGCIHDNVTDDDNVVEEVESKENKIIILLYNH